MNNEIVQVNPKEFGLEETQANDLTKGLDTILKEREVLIEAYEDVMLLEITRENSATFKSLRLQISKNRTTGIEVWRTTNKAYFLAGGNFVQAISNKEQAENKRMEANLLEAEKHYENLEKKRIEDLQAERVELISPYLEDANERDLSGMESDIWEVYLDTKKKDHQAIIAARQKAEEERIAKEKAEAEEQERIKLENAKLKAEAEKLENRTKARNNDLQPFIVYIRDYNATLNLEEKEYQEELKNLSRAKTENEEYLREKSRKENEAKLKLESDMRSELEEKERINKLEEKKREKLEAELKAKTEAELKAKEEEAARIQSELNKGDTAKVKDLITDLEVLKTKYSFKSVKNQKMYTDTGDLIDKVIGHIKK